MQHWTDETAEAALQARIDEIPGLTAVQRFAAPHSRWLANTLRVLEQVFGRRSRYYLSFAEIQWAETGGFMVGGPADPEGSWNPEIAIERRHQEAYRTQLDFAKGILQAAIDDLRSAGIASAYRGKDTGPESSALVKVLSLAENKLRKVIRQPPQHEKEIQDSFVPRRTAHGSTFSAARVREPGIS